MHKPIPATRPRRLTLFAAQAFIFLTATCLAGCGSTDVFSLAENGKTNELKDMLRSDPSLVNLQNQNGRTPLHTAAGNGQKEAVLLLLESGSDPRKRDDLGLDPLALAKNKGHRDCVKVLAEAMGIHTAADCGLDESVAEMLRKDPTLVHVRDEFGRPPLYYAIRSGHPETVKKVLAAGAGPNSPCDDDSSPLHLAAFVGQEEIVKILVENGANPAAKDSEGRTPMYWAEKNGHQGVVALLQNLVGIHQAAAKGDLQKLEEFLAKNPALVDERDFEGLTPLYYAVDSGNLAAVEFLLSKGADVTLAFRDGSTALHAAALKGHDRIAQILIESGVDVFAADAEGRTALYWAKKHGFKELTQLLADLMGVHGAAGKGDTDLLKQMVRENPDLVRFRDTRGRTPLFYAVQNNRIAAATFLLSNGASTEAADKQGLTPLHVAVLKGLPEMVELLLEHGANINARAEKARTPLYWAIKHDQGELTGLLRKHGAVVGGGTETPIHKAVREGDLETVRKILQEDPEAVHAKDGMGWTPLHVASIEGHSDLFRFLLEAGADPTQTDDMGKDPLYWAKLEGHSEIESSIEKSPEASGSASP